MAEKKRSMTVRLTEKQFREIKIKLINDVFSNNISSHSTKLKSTIFAITIPLSYLFLLTQ